MIGFSLARAACVLSVVVAGFGVLAGRVAYLQTYGREKTVRQAERQQHRQQVLPSRRGSVFDRNGLLIAGTSQSKVLFADPKFMAEVFTDEAEKEISLREDRAELLAKGKKVTEHTPEQIEKAKRVFPARYAPADHGVDRAMDAALAEVAAILGRDPSEIIRIVRVKPDGRFVRLAERVDDVAAEAIADLKIPGLGFTPMPVRNYPLVDLASHILGGISNDGVGIDGLEARYEKILRGRDGFLREQADSRGRPIAVTAEDYVAPVHGKHLVLTIDANIQMIAEQELRASIAQFGAKSGEVVVMDPWTGEIMALANWPTYEPSSYLASGEEARINRALVAPYEPGSTIKPFIVGPALEGGVVRVGEVFNTNDGRYRTPYGRMIEDVHAYDHLTVWDILVKSSNIGMSHIGERMGNPKLHASLTQFGFGKPTGIELPGENGGLVRGTEKWSKLSADSLVMGYELMVTPLQLAQATSAIANGGMLVKPTVVRGLVDEKGDVTALRSAGTVSQRALSEETSAEIRRVLADVMVRGTGTRARSDTYNVFGKTGTAHLTEKGKRGYSPNQYTSSFVGGAPLEHPRLVVAFVIHRAEKKGRQYFGGTTAAPGASMVLERSLKYLDTQASPRLELPPNAIIGRLHNYNERAYSEWPENVRKARAIEAAATGKVDMLRPSTRPAGEDDLPNLELVPPPGQPGDEPDARPASDR